jgi:hypothetical protein
MRVRSFHGEASHVAPAENIAIRRDILGPQENRSEMHCFTSMSGGKAEILLNQLKARSILYVADLELFCGPLLWF